MLSGSNWVWSGFLENKAELARRLIVKVNAGPNFGAGIIFSVRAGYLFIATAYHVVRGRENIGVEVEFEFLRGVPVQAAYFNSSSKMDLAVLRVDIQKTRLRDVLLDNVPFELLCKENPLQPRALVFPVGHPGNEPWYAPMSPATVRDVIAEEIRFEFACPSGYSGGGLFTQDWKLVGMILRDHPALYCEAISFERLCATLEGEWKLEVNRERVTSSLQPTPTPRPSVPGINQQRIAQLLQTADTYFARQWYTTPAGTNAFDLYLEVLKLDPTNQQALQQIDRIAQIYKSWAEQAEAQGNLKRASENYRKYLKVVPEDQGIVDKIERLEKQQVQPVATLTPAPTPTPSQEGNEWADPVTGMEFVWIPSGCFQMGCVSGIDCQNDEKPVHEVCVDGFWMGKYEVTQAQWQQIMGSNPSYFKGDNRPVEQVSWNDAQEFIKKLNSRSGTHPSPLPGQDSPLEGGRGVFRLPTEAEWEYACRAGTQTAYYFGNDNSRLGEYAWYSVNSGNQTHPVGQLKPNAWGLYDMHGNVWEWCEDTYSGDAYTNHQRNNPIYRGSGSDRVVRGGIWGLIARDCRAAARDWVTPVGRVGYVGFRLVRTP